ncbi:hypothetical protein KIN20_000657 [Parelaphostrongylus tenuis]|uniref:G-protein coupled receptors family 1 profile domain-containing protein n=1 Tax=Parelaphostrongylus tenuis TaxID=148309 RepID=A0AAD5QE15_PARTN|nr:hypothetical protein KIN20_000657 [Parelaphostrongylus tenuis]
MADNDPLGMKDWPTPRTAKVGVFGLISNCTAILALRTNSALHSSFGLLCLSHSIANAGVLLIFVFWITSTIFPKNVIAGNLSDKLFGMVGIMLWNVCVYSHLAIAFNRFIAITQPLRASVMLTVKNTSIVVLFCWMLAFFHIIPYFWRATMYPIKNVTLIRFFMTFGKLEKTLECDRSTIARRQNEMGYRKLTPRRTPHCVELPRLRCICNHLLKCSAATSTFLDISFEGTARATLAMPLAATWQRTTCSIKCQVPLSKDYALGFMRLARPVALRFA